MKSSSWILGEEGQLSLFKVEQQHRDQEQTITKKEDDYEYDEYDDEVEVNNHNTSSNNDCYNHACNTTTSGVTSPTGTGSVSSYYSEADTRDLLSFSSSLMMGGLGGLGALAVSLKETAGGVVSFVHRSALSVAAEIAELKEDYSHRNNEGGSSMDMDFNSTPQRQPHHHRLPWEVPAQVRRRQVSSSRSSGDEEDDHDDNVDVEEVLYTEDPELKRKIFLLSADENTFLTPFSSSSSQEDDMYNRNDESQLFVLDEPCLRVIPHLLQVDDTLAATHARLSGRSHLHESNFWQNYFYHCEQTRMAHTTSSASARNTIVHVNKETSSSVGVGLTRTTSDDDDETSYVCVNNSDALVSPPSSLNWMEVQREDLLVVQLQNDNNNEHVNH